MSFQKRRYPSVVFNSPVNSSSQEVSVTKSRGKEEREILKLLKHSNTIHASDQLEPMTFSSVISTNPRTSDQISYRLIIIDQS